MQVSDFFRYTESQKLVFMDKSECAMCGSLHFEPHAIVAVCVTAKDYTSRRVYFPFYHVVCNHCHELLTINDVDKEVLLAHPVPSWSLIREFINHSEIRPGGIAELSDPESVCELVKYVNYQTTTWEDFDMISYGSYSYIFEQ